MLAAANIPISKSDHPNVREFFRAQVKDGGAIPSSDRLQRHYLLMVFEQEREALKESRVGKDIAILTEEIRDDISRFVLTVLFTTFEMPSDSRLITKVVDLIFPGEN